MRPRSDNLKCRVRKFTSEETAKRSLWAMRQRQPGKYDNLEVKHCRVCNAYHWVQIRQGGGGLL